MTASENVSELLRSGYRYAFSLTHDQYRAEDILQEAWLGILKANGEHSKPYLFTAIRSRFLNMSKKENLVPLIPLDDVPELLEENEGDASSYYIDQYDLADGLSQLRAVEREALFFVVVEGYTAQEVAHFTQQPRGTILSLVHRAKKKVREYLQKKHAQVTA